MYSDNEKRNNKEKERNKTQEGQGMHKTAHCPLTDAQPVPRQWAVPPGLLCPVYTLGMML